MLQALLTLALLAAQTPVPGAALPLAAGTPLRQLASPVAPAAVVVPEAAAGEVLEVHGGWVRVRWRDATGWVDLRPPVGESTTRAAPPPPTAPAEPALEEARRRLGPELRAGHLGPFDLLTDVEDGPLLERLDTLARQLPPLFAERYGLRPAPASPDGAAAGWTVVLFADDGDYRALIGHVARITGRDPRDLDYVGHAVGRLAFLSTRDGEAGRVERLFLHETAHLLLRRTLGREPPVWLDEGIAGDVEMMPVDGRGRLLAVRLGVGSVPRHTLQRRTGPLARLSDLAEAARRRRLPGSAALLELDRRQLARAQQRPALYALAALFVRYLAEGGGGDLALGFRDYLAGGAEGPLPAALGMEADDLDRGFEGWLIELEARLAG